MSRPVLVLIGAGSTVFTPGLLSDLVRSPVLSGSVVRLVDINEDAAETMARLGHRLAACAGAALTTEAYVDRRAALAGADVVATTIAVGGARGWGADLDIPWQHGIRQTVADTVGPGGVLRALRQVPELVAIGRDVADLAPRAWLINYANPLTANVRAVTGWAHPRAIGLCHGTMHTAAQLATALQVPREQLEVTFAGLNHLCWLLSIRRSDGGRGSVDLYPELRARVAEAVAAGDGSLLAMPVTADLLEVFGRYPAPGDRHVAEFFGDYLAAEPGSSELPWGLQSGLDDTRSYIAEKAELWDRLHGQADGTVALDEISEGQEGERLVAIAETLIGGGSMSELAVNLPNRGLLPELPSRAVVEVPAVVSGDRIDGVSVGPLPPGVAAVLAGRAEQQELTVQAAVHGSAELAVQALALDPLVPDARTARAILAEAVEAHTPWLDAFRVPAEEARSVGDEARGATRH